MMAATKTAINLLLLLAVSALVCGDTCPPEEEITPCLCDLEYGEVVLFCSEPDTTQYQLKQAMNAFTKKRSIHIELDGLELGALPSNFFQGLHVKRLDIAHCTLESLHDADGPALLGLEDSLEELSIASSFTEKNGPAKLSLGHLRHLSELDLSYNEITEVGDDWFDRGPATLRQLTLSNNGIEKIGDRAFANLINLKELSLDGNRFGNIRRSMLPSIGHSLINLELDNNAFTSLPEDLFSNMPSLREFSMRNNGITKFDQRTWQPIWQQLTVLRLEGNPTECDSHMNWIFPMKPTPTISGTCHSPAERHGLDLAEFIGSRQ